MTNGPAYDRAWVQRGPVPIGFEEAFLREHGRPAPTGKRGAPFSYADIAIQARLTLKALFDLPYRLVEGWASSILPLRGVEVRIPAHPRRSRRAKTLTLRIPRRQRTKPVPVGVDSTGLKLYGEGEWKVRPPGAGQRRTWRTVQVAVDAAAQDVLAVEVTTAPGTAGEVFAGLREQMEDPIAQVDGEGAYDTRGVDAAAAKGGAQVAVPPRENAVPWAADHPRTQARAAIATQGLSAWKRAVGAHRRRLADNALYRLNPWFGDRLASRRVETPVTEIHGRVAALNVMTYLGMPVSIPGGVILS